MALKQALSGHCSIERGVAVIGDAWSLLILRDVGAGTRRFEQLTAHLGIAKNILAKRLKALVAAGLLERRRYSVRPPRDDYILTQAGAEFLPILYAIGAWGRRFNGAGVLDQLVDLETGAVIDPVVVDRAGGAPLQNRTLRMVAAEPGAMARLGLGASDRVEISRPAVDERRDRFAGLGRNSAPHQA